MSASIKGLTVCRNAMESAASEGYSPLRICAALAQPDLGHMSGRERLHVFGGAKANPHAVAIQPKQLIERE